MAKDAIRSGSPFFKDLHTSALVRSPVSAMKDLQTDIFLQTRVENIDSCQEDPPYEPGPAQGFFLVTGLVW